LYIVYAYVPTFPHDNPRDVKLGKDAEIYGKVEKLDPSPV
jgi:hypothetical protein